MLKPQSICVIISDNKKTEDKLVSPRMDVYLCWAWVNRKCFSPLLNHVVILGNMHFLRKHALTLSATILYVHNQLLWLWTEPAINPSISSSERRKNSACTRLNWFSSETSPWGIQIYDVILKKRMTHRYVNILLNGFSSQAFGLQL